ncbi:uncharacterized protein B0P05DRAFT_551579 [Gilbertella persicaria]|uniref:F-box domain-containing protein n=1 Tax=Rhizopus stolonifer TaxID=4846 RepID=A0A367K8N7_RHIST|nr:uncharacterized protein B0P05DRAFT_551579 [Gilbertella persicaria]KAI8069104.1 hypothetical protein B0P05DRAFT_551579 [Gilbertella persicaria]RCH98602.1 hypothetical protein CU098_004223 [Rhizopus stolonifer]
MTRDALLKTTTPFPCLDRVFSFLSKSNLLKVALVCRQWHTQASRKIWSSFKFVRERDFERIFSIIAKRTAIAQYGNFITSLELVHSDSDFSINANHIMLITALCPNLLSIDITFDHTHRVAPPVAPHLRRPSQQQQQQQQQRPGLPPVPTTPRQPYTPSLPLAHFAYNCPHLKSIRLVSYLPKTDDSVYEMAKYMTSGSLESITLSHCSTIQSSTLCKLAITNPQLKSIQLNGTTPVSDASLASLIDRCGPTLECLTIGNAHSLTDKSIGRIALKCKKIRDISIFNNTEHVSEDTLTAIITHCPTLETISLSDSRCLGSAFFHSVVQRVNIEMASIDSHQANTKFGLQRLCLGGVKRDMIHSQYMEELIDKSTSKHDINQPTVIRGNTVWWQRLISTT